MRLLLNATGGTLGVSATARYIRSLVRHLPREAPADRVEVFEYLWRKRPFSWTQHAPNLRRRTLPLPPRLGERLLPWIPWVLGRPDVLHLPDDHPLPARARRTVQTIHHGGPLESPQLYDPVYVERMHGWLRDRIDRTDCLVAVSEHMRRTLIERHGARPERVRAIPLGLDPGFTPDGPRREGPPYLLFVGRLSVGKNVEALCRAFRMLSERVPDLELVLVGWDDLGRGRIDEWLGTPEARRRTHTPGPLPADSPRLPELYRGARVFCLPSLGEGWASPPLEAMACGTPVVVSNVSSLPETVGEAGLTVDPHDPEALADALLRCHADEALRQELVQRGLRHAARYTWQETARKTLQLYRDLSAASHPRAGGPWPPA